MKLQEYFKRVWHCSLYGSKMVQWGSEAYFEVYAKNF